MSPAPARPAKACSSIAPAYRDSSCPSPIRGPDSASAVPGPAGSGSPGPVGSAASPFPAGCSARRGRPAASASGPPPPSQGRACCAEPRRRLTVACATPSRAAISASLAPAWRHLHARAQSAGASHPVGAPAAVGFIDGPILVRVIEYTIVSTTANGKRRSELFALVTNLTDRDEAPAGELAALYARRWEIEIVFKALKVDLAACKPVFRSATADGVIAEIWSLLAVYQAIGRLAGDAAGQAGIDPRQISFKRARNALARTIGAVLHLSALMVAFAADVAAHLTRPRPGRTTERRRKARRGKKIKTTKVQHKIGFHPMAQPHLNSSPHRRQPGERHRFNPLSTRHWKAPMLQPDGTLVARGRGTPQCGL